ncbi:kinase-like protein [Gloeophyllum trabeum ATCC 11539]|uniref:Kinase-like protein n=1 Tax=Gloeophyllum trabeum (strain ATCC 11539 / FP-39264 / Madison 617) TaxID=670483 RepID=S7RZM7_GLOTA|nr:kinase-like protein [Gloeophyllum trabeum ATCC 11539]EPQ60470.1 kinase-like protein [Gloeophyllum trabeum ATCC 11539]
MAPTKGRNQNPSGLGRAIINRKTQDARRAQESGLYTTDIDSTARLRSVTQENDLDEFLNTAQLAATDFTAERRNVKIISVPAATSHNPFLLTEEEERRTLERFRENKQRLRVPRRPPWTRDMSPQQLDRQEKDAFLEWRRGLADLQDRDSFLLTPFERNIEVWRQLWRVIERSHLVVQIVDGRNPLRFRCEDLESYVRDVEGTEGEKGTGKGKRRNLLLINKADLLTAKQRRLWADYFDEQGVQYAFFSAANATALQEARKEAWARAEAEAEAEDGGDDDSTSGSDDNHSESTPPHSESEESDEEQEGALGHAALLSEEESSDDELYFSSEEDTADGQDPRAKVLSVLELEALFVRAAPDLSTFADSSGNHPTKLVVGLVGYPNVGKSSTINSLLGEKKVSVSSTPGKTKHFQTINLSPTMTLCDCPGLVFPQFATTKADLTCDGVLPIDQMREYTGPVTLVVKRIPKEVLEATYGLSMRTSGYGQEVTASDLLIPYAISRGFMRSGQGNPDEARAARYILKDYVNAKLLYCHPPPGVPEDDFNQQTRELALKRMAGKKKAPVTRVVKKADTFVPTASPSNGQAASTADGFKSDNLDREFFQANSGLSSRAFIKGARKNGKEFSRPNTLPHQNSVADDGTPPLVLRVVVALSVNKPVTIGRNPAICSYLLSDIVVSSVHCKVYAVPSGDGGVIVSCQQIGAYTVTSHRLGQGSFASVHLALDPANHRQVACKIIKTKKEHELRGVMKEVRILLALNHPNINRAYNVEVNGKFLHIFLQLCTGGDLFAYIVSRKETEHRLCEGEAKYIMYQLLRGLTYLHNKMICHRDLKPENILLHAPGSYPRILIADFGLARPKAYQETLNACGTVCYLPPEAILALDHKDRGYVGMPSDCWSAGVILYIMLTGSHPFDYGPYDYESSRQHGGTEQSYSQFSQASVDRNRIVKERIINYELEFDQSIWKTVPDAQALVSRLLIYDYQQRATVYGAMRSSWIRSDLQDLENAYRTRISSS